MNSKFVARIKKALVSVFALLLTTSFLQTASLAPALAATRYTVTYTSGGAPVGTAPVDASSPYTSLTGRPVKVTALGVGTLENPGYVFNGWDLNSTYSTTCVSYFEGDTFNIGKDASLAAIWDPTVTYHANLADVTGTVPTDSGNDGLGGYDYCSSSTVTVLGNTGTLAKANYKFAGWATSSTATTPDYTAGDTFSITTPVDLYAVWYPALSLSYDANGGSGAPTDSTVYYNGDSATLDSNAPTAAPLHKHFGGWSLDGSLPSISSVTFDASNITVKAIWLDDNSYTLTYDANGGSGAPSDSGVYYNGDSKTLDTNGPSGHPTHQHFGGWSITGSGPAISSVTFSSSDITVKAIWLDDPTYTLTYDANGGSGAPSDSTVYYSGDNPTLETNGPSTAPSHKHFGGWSLTAGGSQVTDVTFDSSDITVYAIWVDDTGFTLTYDANGGSGAPTDSTTYYSGDNPTLDTNGPSTAPLHKHFGGWSLTSGGSAVTSVTFDGADITVYAIWLDDAGFTLTYDANGGSGAPTDSTTYYSGDSVTLNTNGPSTAPLHKHFGGWSLTSGGSAVTSVTFSNSNITVYAIWLNDTSYTLTYNANGGSGAPTDSNQYYSGDTKTLAGGPTTAPTGYKFNCWSLTTNGACVSSVTFSNSNITVYAIWISTGSKANNGFGNGSQPAPGNSCGTNGAANKGCTSGSPTTSGTTTKAKAKSNLSPVSKPIVSITRNGVKGSKSAASKARVQGLAGKKLGKLGQTLALAKVRIVLA